MQTLSVTCVFHQDALEEFSHVIASFPQQPSKGVSVSCDVSESGEPAEVFVRLWSRIIRGETIFSLQISQRSQNIDLPRRVCFFNEAITSLGIQGEVSLIQSGESFRLEAMPTSSMRLQVNGTTPKGENPSSFWVDRVGAFEDAWERFIRLLKDPVVKHIDKSWLGLSFSPPEYEVYLEKLNNFASGWQVDILGSYANGLDPYKADASQSPDGRFPIAVWVSDSADNDVYYQADIVPTREGQFLELRSNCKEMAELLDEAKAATGEEFEPMEPPGGDTHVD